LDNSEQDLTFCNPKHLIPPSSGFYIYEVYNGQKLFMQPGDVSMSVNYDDIAPSYDQRYHVNPLPGVATNLAALAQPYRPGRILEVGCGTGRWLTELESESPQVIGLDRSPGMLQHAQERREHLKLINGDAARLPFPGGSFRFVFCVNALHHFDRPRDFIAEARRLLQRDGRLAIVGMDPHTCQDKWYIYEYFPETFGLDLARFPSGEVIMDWMHTAGFAAVEVRPAERILQQVVGRDILQNHFLQKHGTSQLTLLSDAAYAAGLQRIEAALATAEAAGQALTFQTDISLMLFTGQVQ
jgi:SAM-dependent methyltransferase